MVSLTALLLTSGYRAPEVGALKEALTRLSVTLPDLDQNKRLLAGRNITPLLVNTCSVRKATTVVGFLCMNVVSLVNPRSRGRPSDSTRFDVKASVLP